MYRIFYSITIIVLFLISYCYPTYFVDNTFLSKFINHEIVNVMAVTVSVTMAWNGHILFSLFGLEKEYKMQFSSLKKTLRLNNMFLGFYFILCIGLLFFKSIIPNDYIAFLYAAILTLLLWTVIAMIQTYCFSLNLPNDSEFKKMIS